MPLPQRKSPEERAINAARKEEERAIKAAVRTERESLERRDRARGEFGRVRQARPVSLLREGISSFSPRST
jgi:hypothetical protein